MNERMDTMKKLILRFIGKCLPISNLLRKNTFMFWNKECKLVYLYLAFATQSINVVLFVERVKIQHLVFMLDMF